MLFPGYPHDALEFKIGQMLLVGFRGLDVQENHPIVQDIRKRHIGGVILFDYDTATSSSIRNIQSFGQVKHLVETLQTYTSLPLFIAIDQEGGKVNRLKARYGFPSTVSAHYLGSLNQPEETQKYADRTAATLRELGINLNFAPVVDLDANPENPVIGKVERSFSSDPQVVVTHALTWINAHHAQNVLCTLKHFPGHGSSCHDSHVGCVDVTDTWSSAELIPYREIIAADQCDLVMTAHVFHAKLDPRFPATLSHPIITGLLRQKLGYAGVVIADDLQMQAITSYYQRETAIQLAIEAGVDMFILSNTLVYEPEIATHVSTIIHDLVLRKIIRQERIEESYRRICRLKGRLE